MAKYNHALVESMKAVCKKHTADDNDALYPRVAAGDNSARQDMIRNNMPLVVSVVDAYLSTHPDFEYLRDDLTSAGFLGLTEAASNMTKPEFRDVNVTAYLSRAVRHHIFQSAKHSPYQLTDADQSKRTLSGIDSPERVDTEDQLNHCCETELDHVLISLRKDGYTFQEMAQHLGIARRTLIDAFHVIRDRYIAKSQKN